MDEEEFNRLLNSTEVYEQIKETEDLYQGLSARQDNFTRVFDIHCNLSCGGACCKNFLPTITENEALVLAKGLIINHLDEDFIDNFQNKTNTHCPFFKEDGEYHCPIYQYRPLICRLFNAAASQNKYGEPTFRKCKYNDVKEFDNSLFKFHPKDVITMSSYGGLIEDEDYDKNDITMYDAICNALNKLYLILSLEKEANNN